MKKGLKIFLIIALSSIIGGLCLVLVGLAATGFDPDGFVNAKLVSKSFTFDVNDFDSISVDSAVADVKIVRSDSEGDSVSVNTRLEEKVKSSVEVIEGALTANAEELPWYQNIHIFSSKQSIEIIVPRDFNIERINVDTDTGDTVIDSVNAHSLKLETDTGDLLISSSEITNVTAELDTGDVEINKLNASLIKIDTDTGDVDIKDAVVTDQIRVSTETGETEIYKLSANLLNIDTDTGDININDTLITNKITITTDTGDIDIEDSDAYELNIESDTGEVDLVLLTTKRFDVDSSTGRVRVPVSNEGGICKIRTSTGNIEVRVK